MAKSQLVRYLSLVFDRSAGQRMEQEAKLSAERAGRSMADQFEDAMDEGGRRAGRALSQKLTQEFNTTMARAKVDLAKGVIDPRKFAEIERAAKRAFNEGILSGMDRLRTSGKTTEGQLQTLAGRLKQVGTEGERGTRQAGGALDWLRGRALAAAGAVAGIFAARQIVGFGRDAIQTFTEAEGVWSRLDGALQNAGVSFAEVRGEVERTATAMQDATVVGDEDFAGILTELVQMSSDYAGSLQNVQLVADLAAAKQIDFKTAAQLVGKAMIGETGTLKRYGIVVQEGADAVEVMRERFAGMAEREGKTLGGQVRRLNNEWGDFKEAVGAAMVEAGGGTSVLETLIGAMKGLAQWTERNREGIATFGSGAIKFTTGLVVGLYNAVVSLGNGFSAILFTAVAGVVHAYSWLVEGTGDAIQATAWLNELIGRDEAAAKWEARAKAIDRNVAALRRYAASALAVAGQSARTMMNPSGTGADRGPAGGGGGAGGTFGAPPSDDVGGLTDKQLKSELDLLTQVSKQRALSIGELQRVILIEDVLTGRLRAKNLELEREVELRGRLAQAQGITGTAAAPGVVGTVGARQPSPLTRRTARGESRVVLPYGETVEVPETALTKSQKFFGEVSSMAQDAGASIANAFGESFALLFRDIDNAGEAFKSLWAGIAQGVVGAVGAEAASRAGLNFVKSMEAATMALYSALTGNAAGATGFLKSAAEFAATGAAYSALAGGVGAIAGGGGRGGSVGVPSSRDTGVGIAERAERQGPVVNIYIDPLDPYNPAYQRNVASAQQYAQERYGEGARITVHPRSGR